jgi:hypothetical protein
VKLFDVDLWKRVLTKPEETFDAEKKNASYLAAFLPLILSVIVYALVSAAFLVVSNAELASQDSLVLNLSWFFSTVFLFVFLLGLFLISTLIFYEAAVLLGSKASYRTHVYVVSLFTVPLLWLGLPIIPFG